MSTGIFFQENGSEVVWSTIWMDILIHDNHVDSILMYKNIYIFFKEHEKSKCFAICKVWFILYSLFQRYR